MSIELFKDRDGYTIRKGILRTGCYVSTLTEKDLKSLSVKIQTILLRIHSKKDVNKVPVLFDLKGISPKKAKEWGKNYI